MQELTFFTPTLSSAGLSTRLEDGSSKGCDVFASVRGNGGGGADFSVTQGCAVFFFFLSLSFFGEEQLKSFSGRICEQRPRSPSLMRLLRFLLFHTWAKL